MLDPSGCANIPSSFWHYGIAVVWIMSGDIDVARRCPWGRATTRFEEEEVWERSTMTYVLPGRARH
jgi:hypothetical protein